MGNEEEEPPAPVYTLSRKKQISVDRSVHKNDVSDLSKSREVFKLTEVDVQR